MFTQTVEKVINGLDYTDFEDDYTDILLRFNRCNLVLMFPLET